jgi:hypothetical protein
MKEDITLMPDYVFMVKNRELEDHKVADRV